MGRNIGYSTESSRRPKISLHKQPIYTVPEKTAEIARAIFPNGNLYMKLFDTFGSLFSDQDFAQLFPDNGQPAFSPVRLMLVLMFQFIESLSDRHAADAVRTRIDWRWWEKPCGMLWIV